MGKVTTPVPFVDLATSGEITEADWTLGHLLGQFVTVDTVVGHKRAAFEYNDYDNELLIYFPNNEWVVMKVAA